MLIAYLIKGILLFFISTNSSIIFVGTSNNSLSIDINAENKQINKLRRRAVVTDIRKYIVWILLIVEKLLSANAELTGKTNTRSITTLISLNDFPISHISLQKSMIFFRY